MQDKEKSLDTTSKDFPGQQLIIEDIVQEDKSDDQTIGIDGMTSSSNELTDNRIDPDEQSEADNDTSNDRIGCAEIIEGIVCLLIAVSIVVFYIYELISTQQADEVLREIGFNTDILLSGDIEYLVCVCVVLIGIIFVGNLFRKAIKIKLEKIYLDALYTPQVHAMSSSDKDKFEKNFIEFIEACNNVAIHFTGLIFCIMLFASEIALPMFSENTAFPMFPRTSNLPLFAFVAFLYGFSHGTWRAITIYRRELRSVLKQRHEY